MPCSPLQSHMAKSTKLNQAICEATICFRVYRKVPSMSVYRSSWYCIQFSWNIWFGVECLFTYAKVHERWDLGINLQGLSKVTTESWYIPRVEWISAWCSIHIYRKEKLPSPNFRHNFAKPEVDHSRFLWQLGIVTSHDICLSNWVILLIVLREHAIPRCKILEKLRGFVENNNQETAQMGKRHESNCERNIWTLRGSSNQETAQMRNKKWETIKELLGILFCSSKPLLLSVSMWSGLPQVIPWSRAVQLQKIRWKCYRSKFNHITEQLPLTHTSRQ